MGMTSLTFTGYCTLWNWQCPFYDRSELVLDYCHFCYYSNIIKALRVLYEAACTDGSSGTGDVWSRRRWTMCRNWWCFCGFSPNKGCIIRVLEKPAVSRFGVLPGVLSLFYVLPHRSSIAPRRCARCSGRQATFHWSAEEIVTVWAG